MPVLFILLPVLLILQVHWKSPQPVYAEAIQLMLQKLRSLHGRSDVSL